MFSIARILTKPKPQNFIDNNEKTARIVIDKSGMLVYANDSFLALANMGKQDLGRCLLYTSDAADE